VRYTPREPQWPVVLTEHVFDKVRSLDITLAEFASLLDGGWVIEQTLLHGQTVKEVVLVVEWSRPLHVVVVVDGEGQEERIVTVYEPDPKRWSADGRRRRR
jgi:hypothetical protein